MKKFPICIQHDVMDCGAACIKILAEYYGQSFSLNELKGYEIFSACVGFVRAAL
ncbi:MAG: hypothetical protein LBP72_03535 [Dysgonamonadaceae bacterium]|jgi:ABC-type bacteriocin/lantibiotic exporter with double-glycine peptidase domain|nr:hypothetical protein [Dysgonamonadaceae bacterium]